MLWVVGSEAREDRCESLTSWRSNQGHEFPLGIGVTIDVPLRCLNGSMTGEQLYIAQRATRLVHQPRCPGDKRSPPGMGRTALEADGLICAREPDDDAQRGHRTAAFGQHDRPSPLRNAAPTRERIPQIFVQRDQAATAFLCGMIAQPNSCASGAFARLAAGGSDRCTRSPDRGALTADRRSPSRRWSFAISPE
jgi:hypothetical protein